MTLPYRERGTVPTVDEHDPLDWALERLSWKATDSHPPDWDYDYDLGSYRDRPINGIDSRVIKALITHMIRNADYEGLGVAMIETYQVLADQEAYERTIRANERMQEAVHDGMLTHPCKRCKAAPGEACVTTSGTQLSSPHSRRGALPKRGGGA